MKIPTYVSAYMSQNGFNHVNKKVESGRELYTLSVIDKSGVELPVGLPTIIVRDTETDSYTEVTGVSALSLV